tara:strand:- start:321 stop:563 length:243 start_codon:yes stop_codon:yes gene_type:complete
MGKMSDYAIDQQDNMVNLLEEHGDLVDIHYTQFLEVAFFLRVAASEEMAVAFVKRKLPQLSVEEIRNMIYEIVNAYQSTL